MRNKLLAASAAALLLASTTTAWAQAKPQPAPTAAPTATPAPSNGSLDVGGRFTSTTGDAGSTRRSPTPGTSISCAR